MIKRYLIILVFIPGLAFSKPLLKTIKKHIQSFEWDEARQQITSLLEDKLYQKNPEIWYYLGIIENEQLRNIIEGTKEQLEKTLNAYNKVLELSPKNGFYQSVVKRDLQGLWDRYLSRGIQYGKEFDRALESFENCKTIQPDSKLPYLYTAITLQSKFENQGSKLMDTKTAKAPKLIDKETAKAPKLIDTKTGKVPKLMDTKADKAPKLMDKETAKDIEENYKKYLSNTPLSDTALILGWADFLTHVQPNKANDVIEQALQTTPYDQSLLDTRESIYRNMYQTNTTKNEETEEKDTYLVNLTEKLSAANSKTDIGIAHYQLGYALEQNQQEDKAIYHYQQSIIYQDTHPEPDYQIGMIYYQRAAQECKQLEGIADDKFESEGMIQYQEIRDNLHRALYWLKRSNEKGQSDKSVIGYLAQIYRALEMPVHARNINKKY